MANQNFETDRVLFFDSFDQDIFQNEPLPEVVSALRDKLLKAIKDGKWVLFEFNRDNVKPHQEWVRNMHRFCAGEGVSFALFGVLGDRSKMAGNMGSIYYANFVEVGAILKFYNGEELSLLDALKRFDQEILDTDNARETRNAKLSEVST